MLKRGLTRWWASQQLKSKKAAARKQAVETIAAEAPARFIDLLAPLLADPVLEVRCAAAQADAGQLQLTRAPVDLSAELEGMIEDARVFAGDSRLTFDVQIASPTRVAADRALLHTALFNLIGNAIKYNEPASRVEIRLAAADKTAFTIGNTGPGISPADQPRLFERFFRPGRAGRPRTDGLGLGLSLAREIIRAHGGELVLKESRNGWTCFEAILPALRS